MIAAFLQDRRGTTAIEYALIAGVITVGIVGALGMIGEKLQASLATVAGYFN
jgi:Flp pilus assembly pilin Flp